MAATQAPEPPPDFPRFLRRRSLIAAVVAAFAIFSGAALFLSWAHYRDTRETILKNNRAKAEQLSLLLEEHLFMIIRTLESYASRPSLVRSAGEKSAAGAAIHLHELTTGFSGMDATSITDKEGVLWSRVPAAPEAIGRSFAFRDWYRGVSRKWQPYVSEAFLRVVEDKDAAVVVAVPIFYEEEVIGILVNSLRLLALAKLIERIELENGETISVTDKKGNLVYSNRTAFDAKIVSYEFYDLVKREISHQDRAVTVYISGGEGVKYHVSYAPIAAFGWSVFVEQESRSVLLRGLTYYLLTMLVAGLLLALVTVSLLYYRRQIMTRRQFDELLRKSELQAQEVRYRELFDNMSGGVVVCRSDNGGKDFIILDINKAGQKIVNVDRDSIGKNIALVFPGVIRLGLLEVFQEVEKTGQAACHPVSLYKDNQLAFWAEYHVYKLPSGEIVAVFDDVTRRLQAEEELRASEQRQKRYVELMTRLIREGEFFRGTLRENFERIVVLSSQVFKTERTSVWFFNDDYEKLTCACLYNQSTNSISEGDSLDSSLFPGYTKALLNGEILAASDVKNDPRTREIPIEYYQERGIFSVMAVPVWAEGKLRAVLSFEHTQKKHEWLPEEEQLALTLASYVSYMLEAQQRAKKEYEVIQLNEDLERRVMERTAQLEAVNKELEAFSYSVSHDLRAPLRGIDGFSKALLEDYQDKLLDEAGAGYIARIRRATQRMGVIIDDMLKLARVTQAAIRRETVDLSLLAEKILRNLQQDFPDRHLDLKIQTGVVAEGDPHLLEITMANLLDNAWKFTGKIALPRIEFGAIDKDGKKLYFVRDNGAGFDMTYADKLFGAFQRLHNADEFPGTGVGLATARRIINRHGGRIWAEGEVAKGATFYFTLS